MTPATLTKFVLEGDDVRRWRLEELVRAGYPPYVDLQLARTLLRRGRPVRTALRILL